MSARIWKTRRNKRLSMLRWLRAHGLPDNYFCLGVMTGVDFERRTVTIESIADAAHPLEDPWTRRWKGSTP